MPYARLHAPRPRHVRERVRRVSLVDIRVDIVVLASAVSAGIHAALVAEHFEEGIGAGTGFVVAAALLGALAIVLTAKPSELALVGTAAVFAGLILSYVFVLTTGVPVLHPEAEGVDGLALFTKAVEALGLMTAASLVRRPSLLAPSHPKGTAT